MVSLERADQTHAGRGTLPICILDEAVVGKISDGQQTGIDRVRPGRHLPTRLRGARKNTLGAPHPQTRALLDRTPAGAPARQTHPPPSKPARTARTYLGNCVNTTLGNYVDSDTEWNGAVPQTIARRKGALDVRSIRTRKFPTPFH